MPIERKYLSESMFCELTGVSLKRFRGLKWDPRPPLPCDRRNGDSGVITIYLEPEDHVAPSVSVAVLD